MGTHAPGTPTPSYSLLHLGNTAELEEPFLGTGLRRPSPGKKELRVWSSSSFLKWPVGHHGIPGYLPTSAAHTCNPSTEEGRGRRITIKVITTYQVSSCLNLKNKQTKYKNNKITEQQQQNKRQERWHTALISEFVRQRPGGGSLSSRPVLPAEPGLQNNKQRKHSPISYWFTVKLLPSHSWAGSSVHIRGERKESGVHRGE